jgi:hypothetical protein
MKKYIIYTVSAAAGITICLIDNYAMNGEISPIVIVLLLFSFVAALSAFNRNNVWLGTLLVWVWLPASHLVKHLFDLPDSIHPNTYHSILLLALFTLTVSVIGLLAGTGIRRVIRISR